MSTQSDYAYRIAASKRAKDMHHAIHITSEALAWTIVISASVLTFALSVLGGGQ